MCWAPQVRRSVDRSVGGSPDTGWIGRFVLKQVGLTSIPKQVPATRTTTAVATITAARPAAPQQFSVARAVTHMGLYSAEASCCTRPIFLLWVSLSGPMFLSLPCSLFLVSLVPAIYVRVPDFLPCVCPTVSASLLPCCPVTRVSVHACVSLGYMTRRTKRSG